MKSLKKILCVLLALAVVFSFAACSANNDNKSEEDTEKKKTEITVCLDWTPNTNHTGLYTALANGYYADAGLDVKIMQPPENGATEACSAGQVQFAIDAQDTLAAAFTSATPMEVTAVAALIQHNTSGIMSYKGNGMDTPKGLEGNEYLTWESPIELAIMKNVVTKDGGDWSKVKLIPNTVTDEAQDVKQNPKHSIWVFYGWGGINAEVNKVDTDYFYFKDLNPTFDYYTPVLIANNEFLKTNPEAAKAFLAATKKGYEYAIENPEKAAQILIDGDETKSLVGSEELVVASQKWLANEYKSDVAQWGYIDPARWDAFYAWLYEEKLIEKELPAGTGFSNDYLA